MKKIVTILGARPQFIKAAAVSNLLREHFNEIIVHTGQHFDTNMSDIFFNQLNIPNPDYNLNLNSLSHTKLTASMMIKIEEILLSERPDYVVVYGDTNSTLAGSLTAAKMEIPIIHIESGPRMYIDNSPEEINRKLTDHVSKYLFCCTENCVSNLKREGIEEGVYFSGDVMYDLFLKSVLLINNARKDLLEPFGKENYIFLTMHRQENVDFRDRLNNIVSALINSGENIIFPVHPRTKHKLKEFGMLNEIESSPKIKITEPLGYIDTIFLEKNSKKIVTDSGGVQREAYFVNKPCISMLPVNDGITSWQDLVNYKYTLLVGSDKERLEDAISNFTLTVNKPGIFGDGNAAEKIVDYLVKCCK